MSDNAAYNIKNITADGGGDTERSKRTLYYGILKDKTDYKPQNGSCKKRRQGLDRKREPVSYSCFHIKHILPKSIILFSERKEC